RCSQTDGVWLGIALLVAVVAELVLGGAILGLDNGQYVLAVGFVLDAAARAVGTVAAGQRGDVDAGWISALVGSPALWGLKSEPESGHGPDLVGLARVTAIVAGITLAFGAVLVLA
ncbi:MAG: hypothetical protein J2O48_02485, partial [Solirubrobacterales bacterium]|nr:hypothetical protein [Solirubrobacterales bacterium]